MQYLDIDLPLVGGVGGANNKKNEQKLETERLGTEDLAVPNLVELFASLDTGKETTKYNLALTINLSPKYRVLRKGQKERYRWDELTGEEQKEYLKMLNENENCKEFVYELTQAGMYHSHGVIKTNLLPQEVYQQLLNKKTYMNIVKTEKRLRCMFCVKLLETQEDLTRWGDYMKKKQEA